MTLSLQLFNILQHQSGTRTGFTLVSTDDKGFNKFSNSDTVSSESDENALSWASPDSDEPRPCARESGKHV